MQYFHPGAWRDSRVQPARASLSLRQFDVGTTASGGCRSAKSAGPFWNWGHRLRAPERTGLCRTIEERERLRHAGQPEQASLLRCLRYAGHGGGSRRQRRGQAVHRASGRNRSVGEDSQRRLPIGFARRLEWAGDLLRSGRHGINGRRTCGRRPPSGYGESTRRSFGESTRRGNRKAEDQPTIEIPGAGSVSTRL